MMKELCVLSKKENIAFQHWNENIVGHYYMKFRYNSTITRNIDNEVTDTLQQNADAK